jgi:site-specific recombinase XerD
MNNLNRLNELLNDAIITREEYELFKKRLTESKSDYDKTWSDVLDGFYQWCLDKYSVTTAKGYKTCLYKFISYLTKSDKNDEWYDKKFELYSFIKVNNYINKLHNSNFSHQSINKQRYAIAVFGKYLNELGIDAPNIDKIKVSIRENVNNTTIALRHDEIEKIINAGDLRSKVCLSLAYEGALKRIELCEIKVKDFDFNKKQLYIYNGNKLERVCVLSDETINTVQTYIDELYADIEHWNKNRILKGREPREDFGYIFQNVKTTTPSYSSLQTMIKENATNYYKSLGLSDEEVRSKTKNVTFETLRNSRKVYMLANGVPTVEVMSVCGEKNYMGTYRFVKLVPILYPEKTIHK